MMHNVGHERESVFEKSRLKMITDSSDDESFKRVVNLRRGNRSVAT